MDHQLAQQLNNAIEHGVQAGLTPKETMTGILSYAQYHNKFHNIFEIYEKRYKEHNVYVKRHEALERILNLV